MTPVLLVTGTSSGIGLATALAGARAGYRTVATVRHPDRADGLRPPPTGPASSSTSGSST